MIKQVLQLNITIIQICQWSVVILIKDLQLQK